MSKVSVYRIKYIRKDNFVDVEEIREVKLKEVKK